MGFTPLFIKKWERESKQAQTQLPVDRTSGNSDGLTCSAHISSLLFSFSSLSQSRVKNSWFWSPLYNSLYRWKFFKSEPSSNIEQNHHRSRSTHNLHTEIETRSHEPTKLLLRDRHMIFKIDTRSLPTEMGQLMLRDRLMTSSEWTNRRSEIDIKSQVQLNRT